MRKAKILVVDDEQDYLRIACLLLKQEGYDIQTAATGKKGFELAVNHQPDLVILDIGLPDIDGIEVSRMLQENSRTSKTRVIFFSVYSDLGHLRRALYGRKQKYIIKPFDPEELIRKVKESLSD
mgnify:CR=1 FL=1